MLHYQEFETGDFEMVNRKKLLGKQKMRFSIFLYC